MKKLSGKQLIALVAGAAVLLTVLLLLLFSCDTESERVEMLYPAGEIRTLASAGIECRFVGSGESFSEDDTSTLSWGQAVEHICQWTGDSFIAKTGEESSA